MIGLFFSWLIIYVFCGNVKIDYEHTKRRAFLLPFENWFCLR